VIQKGARADDAFDDDKYLAAAVETGPIRICLGSASTKASAS